MEFTTILFIALIVIGLFFIVIYNRLVALRQNRKNAFADIDVQLKQRADLIPNLVETVKGYAGHEKQVLENITQARSRVGQAHSLHERIAAENQLSGALMNLFAVAENYPQLKANENFASLQRELADIENKVAAARRFFNNATDEFNTAVQQFPANIVAGIFGFRSEEYFGLTEAERAQTENPPKVSFQ